MMMDYSSCASSLYDGGWRSDDIEQLITEYDLSEYEADNILYWLMEFEHKNV